MKTLKETDVTGLGVGIKDDAPPEKEVRLCRRWLRKFATPTRDIEHTRAHSYELKHRVEDWTQIMGGMEYVSNGAFIIAAIREGYRAVKVRFRPDSINACFNMSWKMKWRKWLQEHCTCEDFVCMDY